jgi:hypothetical protein
MVELDHERSVVMKVVVMYPSNGEKTLWVIRSLIQVVHKGVTVIIAQLEFSELFALPRHLIDQWRIHALRFVKEATFVVVHGYKAESVEFAIGCYFCDIAVRFLRKAQISGVKHRIGEWLLEKKVRVLSRELGGDEHGEYHTRDDPKCFRVVHYRRVKELI